MKKLLKKILSIILALNLAGCATQKKAVVESKIEELNSQISELERQIQEKDEEIVGLEDELRAMQEGKTEKAVRVKIKTGKRIRLSRKEKAVKIQTALKNAGFYQGPVDGRIGKNTKRAIKEFQKANGLRRDGIVGKRTWAALERFFEDKATK